MPTPLNSSTFVLHTLSALWENLPAILLGGLLFSLFCAPAFILLVLGWIVPAFIVGVLLVGPAWSALMHMQAALLAGKAAPVVEMWHAVRQFWRPSFRLGVIGILPCYALYRLFPLLAQPDVAWGVWAMWAGTLFITAFVCALYLYAFPLTVMYKPSLLVVLRNSALLASQYAGNTVGLLSMGLLFALAIVYLSPALLFIVPTFYSLFIVNHCRLAVGEHDKGSSLTGVNL